MNEFLAVLAALIVFFWKIFLNAQKHNVEKTFDSQSEKLLRKILYEVLGGTVVLFVTFFCIPILEPGHKAIYYIIYMIGVVVFFSTQTIETVIVIMGNLRRPVSRFLLWYDSKNFWISVLQVIIYSVVLIAIYVHIYAAFNEIVGKDKISDHTMAGVVISTMKEIENEPVKEPDRDQKAVGEKRPSQKEEITKAIVAMGGFFTLLFCIYGLWRMIVSAPWFIIKKRFEKKYSYSFEIAGSLPLKGLTFVNSSNEYFLCFDEEKKEHVLIYKNTVMKINIKPQ